MFSVFPTKNSRGILDSIIKTYKFETIKEIGARDCVYTIVGGNFKNDRLIMKDFELKSEIFWVKIFDFLQQNWALIEEVDSKIIVFFIQDASMVFDKIEFETIEDAENGLIENGFKLYLDEKENFQDFIVLPKKPYGESPRPINSSGQYWKQ